MERIVSASIGAPWGPVRLAGTSRGLAALDQLVSNEAFAERLEHRFGSVPIDLDAEPGVSVRESASQTSTDPRLGAR